MEIRVRSTGLAHHNVKGTKRTSRKCCVSIWCLMLGLYKTPIGRRIRMYLAGCKIHTMTFWKQGQLCSYFPLTMSIFSSWAPLCFPSKSKHTLHYRLPNTIFKSPTVFSNSPYKTLKSPRISMASWCPWQSLGTLQPLVFYHTDCWVPEINSWC